MVLPAHLRKTITPAEVNFQAESELVTILPRYLMKKIELIGVSRATGSKLRMYLKWEECSYREKCSYRFPGLEPRSYY